MEKTIRNLLRKLLGNKGYLSLVSKLYIKLVRVGMLKSKYPELFYLDKLIKPGFICVDIGANVGYYTTRLSNLTGISGHVYSIEPVPLFAQVFLSNCRQFALNNVTLYQVALGAENRKVVLETPVLNNVFRHGLTHIVEETETSNGEQYTADMVVADELFEPMQRIDFLKCDVEGYEVHLFPHLINTLKRCRPVLQIEIGSEQNRTQMHNLLSPLKYKWFGLNQGQLSQLNDLTQILQHDGDFYLLPEKN